MAGEPLSYWDYVKAAFWKPVRSRVLGAMPLTQMLLVSFGLAGFVNPGFWLLGLAATVAFVGGRSSSERFQKLVEAERLAARAGTAEDRMKAAYERLEPASQARYRALVVVCREILGLGAGAGESGLTDFRAGNLNQMLSLFLRLLASREAITDTLARVDRRQLETGLENLKARRRVGRRPRGRARAVAQGHPRDPGEAPRQPGDGHHQRGGGGRRARADRAAGAPRARGERGEPLAGGALRAARRRLADARRDLALPRPARGDLLRRVRDRLRDRLRAPRCRASRRKRPRSSARPRRARASASASDEAPVIPGTSPDGSRGIRSSAPSAGGFLVAPASRSSSE